MRYALLLLLFAAAPHLIAADVEIPFELDEGHSLILVTTQVNGRDALTIVDTGAPLTMFSPAAAGVDSFAMARSRFMKDSPGFLAVGVNKQVRLTFGGTTRDRVVGAVDMSKVRETYRRPIDGLIGQDVLRELKRVVIDYERRVLILTR